MQSKWQLLQRNSCPRPFQIQLCCILKTGDRLGTGKRMSGYSLGTSTRSIRDLFVVSLWGEQTVEPATVGPVLTTLKYQGNELVLSGWPLNHPCSHMLLPSRLRAFMCLHFRPQLRFSFPQRLTLPHLSPHFLYIFITVCNHTRTDVVNFCLPHQNLSSVRSFYLIHSSLLEAQDRTKHIVPAQKH